LYKIGGVKSNFRKRKRTKLEHGLWSSPHRSPLLDPNLNDI